MTTSLTRPRAVILALLSLAVVAGGGFMIWSHEHAATSHDHHASHTAVAPTTPALDGGQRWTADAPLRTGMRRIRDAAGPALASHARAGISAPQAAVLSSAIQEQVRYIVSNCQLAPKPDAALHAIIIDLVRGAGLLVDDAKSAEGITLVSGALRRYPEFFDHPGWTSGTP